MAARISCLVAAAALVMVDVALGKNSTAVACAVIWCCAQCWCLVPGSVQLVVRANDMH